MIGKPSLSVTTLQNRTNTETQESEEREMELKFRRNDDYQDLRDEITPEKFYLDRRKLIAAGGVMGAGSILGALPACSEPQGAVATPARGPRLARRGDRHRGISNCRAIRPPDVLDRPRWRDGEGEWPKHRSL